MVTLHAADLGYKFWLQILAADLGSGTWQRILAEVLAEVLAGRRIAMQALSEGPAPL